MKINIRGVLKGTVFSLIVTFVIIIVLSLLAYFTSIGEGALTIGVYAAVIIGVLIGSFALSKAAQGQCLIHSMLSSLAYLLILIGISFLINRQISFNTHFFAISGGVLAAGFVGSVIGK
ncbi:MAG: TIGR04086 family membrane protein [Clostridia bacterium]|nr:TIGR04086 family membrane protein [Clostridia bacterium]